MRHLVDGGKLGRPTGHRMSMLRNLVTCFFERERIRTTLPRARELRSLAEKMITLAKRGELHHRRQVLRIVSRKSTVKKLFDKIAPRFAARDGGYTRLIKIGPRHGDGADTAYLELIGSEFVPKVKKDKGKAKKGEKTTEKEAESKETKKEETHEEVKEPRRKIFGKWGPSDKVEKHAKTRQQKQHIKAPSSGQ